MTRWALLIGISQYQHSGFFSDQAAVNNVMSLDRCLQRAGYTTIVLQDEATVIPANLPPHWPTRSNIEKQLQHLCNTAADHDLIVVYFVGYGIETTGSLLLFGQDAQNREDGIELEHLFEILRQRQMSRSLFILEMMRTDFNVPLLAEDASALLENFFFASTILNDRQQHPDQSKTTNTLFMRLLLEGLSGKADREKKGSVTVQDLGQYVVDAVQALIQDAESEVVEQKTWFQCTDDLATAVLIDFSSLSVRKTRHRAHCFTEPTIHLDLMLIPGGTFLMGSPDDELDRYNDEGPQHQVTVPTFLMGRYPVTQLQWRSIANRIDLKVNHDLEPDPANFKGDDRPIERVSWYEAVEFCDRLSRLTGHFYRLPTEAEWEYACRAGTTTPFHFGETITTDLANYRGTDDESMGWSGSYSNGPKGIYRETTTSVNEFVVANAFGLCDMHGNVWEWCLDHRHSNYEGAPTDGSAWLSVDENARRVIRGGSWYYDPRDCRSAIRYKYFPENRDFNVGFRVVCEVRSC